MTCCPSDERLALLLEEQLGRDELDRIERHLEGCDLCQGALEGLTRERISLADWRPWSGEAPGEDNEAGSRSSFDGLGPEDSRERERRRARREHDRRSRPSTLLTSEIAGEERPGVDGNPRVDGYEILGRLGQGGMGVVYKARQRGLDRMVALKMVRAGLHAGTEQLTRFRIEVRAVARLRHPNVVQVYDVGEAGGLPYVALELLEGGSLDDKVAGTPRPERWAAELLATLARAIASAHRAGVIHRDLKPANVLFTTDGTAKVADFGLAKRLDEDDGQTHSGQVMGSPSFMAPEQARGRGREVGPSADIYSLGALLYETLTGRPPFKGGSAMETLFQVVNDDPLPPSRLRPGLSRDLETICLKCLEKDARRRYPDADALADDLGRFLAGSPILARRVGPRERLWKWARRQPAAAALLVAALAALLVLSIALARQGKAARARADWLVGRRTDYALALSHARDKAAQGRWADGQRVLREFLISIKGDPSLSDLREGAETLLASIDRESAARARLADFGRWRREAQLRDVQFAGIDQRDNVQATRRAARAALDAFGEGPAGEDWSPSALPESLSPDERAGVERGRRELLLAWAEATARPLPGEDPARQAARSLRALDRAAEGRPPSLALLLLRASIRESSGDAPGAARDRAEAEAIPPVDALDRLLKGRELLRAGRWIAAIAEFEEALRLEPDQFRAQLLLAVAQLQVGRTGPARAGLNACLHREPGAIYLHLLRGFAYGEEANEKRRVARESTPRLVALEAEAEAQFEAAEADYRTALGLNPDDDARYAVLVNRGVLRVRSLRLDEAVVDLREAVRLRPDHFAAYVPLGQAYGKQGRVDDAVEQFTKGLAIKPDLPALRRCRALARIDRGRPGPEAREEAIRDLSEAIRIEPPASPEAAADRARRARLLLLSGKPAEALADADEAIRIAPDDPDASVVRVKALLELKRYPEVVAACDDALGRGRRSADLHELRGLARANTRDYPGAIQDYTQSLTLDPSRASPLIQRGWAYIVSDAPKLALHDFDEAVRIAPDVYTGRGFARALLGQHRAATADADESLRRAGDPDARVTYNAARIYARAASSATEGPRRGLGQVRVAEDYQDRAHALIRLAFERLPADRRAGFWRDVVQGDPALAAIRQNPKFSRLAGQLGREAR